MAQGKVSGKLVVFLLFGFALLLAGIVLTVGFHKKAADAALAAGNGSPSSDSAVTPDSVRSRLAALPKQWIKVTAVEGQGFVIFVPCYSSNSLVTLKTAADSVPGLDCEYCDSLDSFSVRAVARNPSDSSLRLSLAPAAGKVEIVPVRETLLQRYPEAPFRSRLLLWIRSKPVDSTVVAPPPDTMFFVPKAEENEFEVLRAEDENPEGCGGDSSD